MNTSAANNNSIFGEEYRIADEIDTTANNIARTERWATNLIILLLHGRVAISKTDSTRIAVITNKIRTA